MILRNKKKFPENSEFFRFLQINALSVYYRCRYNKKLKFINIGDVITRTNKLV